MASPITSNGNPRAQDFNSLDRRGRDAGFRHENPKIDDDTAIRAGQELGAAPGVIRDAGAIEIQFDRLAQGEMDFDNDYFVPGWVAQNGMDATRREGVNEVLDQMGEIWGRSDLADMAKEMYADGIESQFDAQSEGVRPYGLRQGEYGSWNNP